MVDKITQHWQRYASVYISAVPYIVFIFLASYIARSKNFLPYDEPFHFGLIRLYAGHILPFLSGDPVGSNAYGAVARDPSYLYHYLLSFPYRLSTLITQSQLVQIYILRAVNIALGLCSLFLVKKVAYRFGLSRIVSYLICFALAVTPVFYDLSAQINYDNLLLPLTLLSLLLTLRLATSIRQRLVPAPLFIGFISLGLLTSLVKYTFLPIMFGLLLYLCLVIWRNHAWKSSAVSVYQSFLLVSHRYQLLLGCLLVGSMALWFQRYGVNIIAYHTPIPNCNQVLSVSQCMAYGPWARNYQLTQANTTHLTAHLSAIPTFLIYWVKNVYAQVFSVVTVDNAGAYFLTNSPIKIISKILLILGLSGSLLSVMQSKKRRRPWGLVVIVLGSYIGTLLLQNYSDYRSTAEFIGIQGRYLVPVIALLYILVAFGLTVLYKQVMQFVVGWMTKR